MMSWTEALDVLRAEGALEPGTLPRKGTAAYRRLQDDARSIGWEPVGEPRSRSMSRSRSRARSRSRSVGGRLKACGTTRDGTQKVRTEDRPRCHDPRVVPRPVSAATRRAPCSMGLVRSATTGRCYRPREPADCKAGQERNPATGRCRKPVAPKPDCKPGWERYPATGRCRKTEKAPRRSRSRARSVPRAAEASAEEIEAFLQDLAQQFNQPAAEIEDVAAAADAPLAVAAERLAEVHAFPEALAEAAAQHGFDPNVLAQQIAEASILDRTIITPQLISEYAELIAFGFDRPVGAGLRRSRSRRR